MVRKLTDDLLLAGSNSRLNGFASPIQKRLSTEKVIVDDKINFNGRVITQSGNGAIKVSMQQYFDNIQPVTYGSLDKKSLEKASEKEVSDFRRMAGELVWLGSTALLQASYLDPFCYN